MAVNSTALWTEVMLGDTGRIVTGRTPASGIPDCFGSDYPFITPTDMDGNKYIRVTERSLSHKGRAELERCMIPPGSVAVSCIGWQLGKAAVTTTESATNQQLNTIIPNGSVDPDFLYYHLLTRRDELKRLGSVGTRTPIVNKSVFASLRLSVPSHRIQRWIASILSAYDDLIENNLRRIHILDEMSRVLYREWFVNFRFPGHQDTDSVESQVGLIPTGWRVWRLGDVASDVRDGVPKGALASEQPLVGLEHIPRRALALDAWDVASVVGSNKLKFRTGDVLFGKIRPYFHKVSLAPFGGVCSADTIVIRPKSPEHHSLIAACVSSDAFVSHASATSNGSKMPRADWKVLREYLLVAPTKELNARFDSFLSAAVTQQQTLVFANVNLRQARDLLLPRLLSGHLSLEDVEPAA